MEATAAKVRQYVRAQLAGVRVWRIGVNVTPTSARVTLYTPDKPDGFLLERDKGRPSIVKGLEQKLEARLGRSATVEAVQSPMAVARFIRISPRKVRHVVDTIRGKPVQDALATLQFLPNAAAKTVEKLIRSAMANAENNHRMDAETLEVMHVHVDEGPTLKRISPRAMGRAYRIMKRTSHITVGLAESQKPSRLAGRGKGVARTVGKAPRRGGKAETGRAETGKPARRAKQTTAPAAEAPKARRKTAAEPEQQGGE